MAVLHLLRSSPFESSQIDNMLAIMKKDDKVVLVDDGCYLVHHRLLELCAQHVNSNIAIIDEHKKARNIVLDERVQIISYKQLTHLFTEHKSTITW